jgi:hypothetical protein
MDLVLEVQRMAELVNGIGFSLATSLDHIGVWVGAGRVPCLRSFQRNRFDSFHGLEALNDPAAYLV